MTVRRWVLAVVVIAAIVLLIAYARGHVGRDNQITSNQRWLAGYTRAA